MVSFTKVLPPALFALLFTLTTSATPTHDPTTQHVHGIGADKSVKLKTYHPRPIFEVYGVKGVDLHPDDRRYSRGTVDMRSDAISFLATKLGIPEEDIQFRAMVQGDASLNVYLSQHINGVTVANAVAKVSFNNIGTVSSFSSSFVELSGAADTIPSVTPDDAIATAERELDGSYTGDPITIEYILGPEHYAALAYLIQIANETASTRYTAFVDAHHNTLLSVRDHVRKASYRALPIYEQIPAQGFQTIVNPQNLKASPDGWHEEFDTVYNQTAGNNLIAYNGSQLIFIPTETSATLNFIYPVDLTRDPTYGVNVQAAIVNAFYVVNLCHDFSYLYGFTEATFNFQTNNFNKAGQGFDRILVSVQDSSGTNGVDFTIYPDGQSPKMQLYLYVNFSPRRDSALQNDILIHEFQHGVTNRMTAGGNVSCYQTTESSGIDEGNSDAMADVISQQSETTVDFVFGKGVSTSPTGLRNYVYSTSNTTNPLRYSSLKSMTNPYDIASLWANTLHNVYAALVDVLGWSPTALTNANTLEGNVVWLHLFFDSLLLLPCSPTLLQARDSFIQADANRYEGKHTCVLWITFAGKGFGVNATNYIDDFDFPEECC